MSRIDEKYKGLIYKLKTRPEIQGKDLQKEFDKAVDKCIDVINEMDEQLPQDTITNEEMEDIWNTH